VPSPPAASPTTARASSPDSARARLGQQVLVENRPARAANIGTQAVRRLRPTGYTLLLGFDGTMVINPHVFRRFRSNAEGLRAVTKSATRR